MKLWKAGVRIFKGLSKFRVYHFGSIVLRKKKNFRRNKGSKTFLIKWGVSPTFFVKHFLKGGVFKQGKIVCKKFDGALDEPNKNIFYYKDFYINKIYYFIINYLKKNKYENLLFRWNKSYL